MVDYGVWEWRAGEGLAGYANDFVVLSCADCFSAGRVQRAGAFDVRG